MKKGGTWGGPVYCGLDCTQFVRHFLWTYEDILC